MFSTIVPTTTSHLSQWKGLTVSTVSGRDTVPAAEAKCCSTRPRAASPAAGCSTPCPMRSSRALTASVAMPATAHPPHWMAVQGDPVGGDGVCWKGAEMCGSQAVCDGHACVCVTAVQSMCSACGPGRNRLRWSHTSRVRQPPSTCLVLFSARSSLPGAVHTPGNLRL